MPGSSPACASVMRPAWAHRDLTASLQTTSTHDADAGRMPEARLLVVDDEPNIVELLSASLRFAGFEVETAAGGLEAVDAARSFRPDLLVLDVMMPGLDGFGVVRRLRQEGDRTPVLFLTAKDAT